MSKLERVRNGRFDCFYRRAETLYAPKNRAKLIISLLSLSPVEKKNQNSLWSTLGGASFLVSLEAHLGQM